MKTLYLDCSMGAAGDMLSAALLELLPDADAFLQELNSLGIPGVSIEKEAAVKCGIQGTHLAVKVGDMQEDEGLHAHGHESICQEHDHSHAHESLHQEYDHSHVHESLHHAHDHSHVHEDIHQEHGHSHGHAHHHSSMHDIEHIVSHLKLEDKVKSDILAVYSLIAEAESHVHGVPVTDIHFHEVGTMDAIADITAACLLMNRIAPDEVVATPVHVGSGEVRCAHGILPVPAPATAYLLRDIPVYGGAIKGELCTPTGAAILKHFVTRFGEMPVMKVRRIGYGMGKKDFDRANCVRAMLGDTKEQENTVLELSCNVDDMTAEEIGFAMECLFEGGALEVYTVPIGMKKSRPGILIRVMCREEEREKMAELLFKHTTTLGIRETKMRRYVLERKSVTVDTPYGPVRRKDSAGYGVERSKYEYDDLSRIAKEKGISIAEVRRLVEC